MSDLKICRICLRTEAKGYKFHQLQLKCYYEEVIALKVDADSLPQWFCYECATLLHKFHKFKEKCYIGLKMLKEMLWKGPLTYEAIYKVDRTTTLSMKPVETLNIPKKQCVKSENTDVIEINNATNIIFSIEEDIHNHREIFECDSIIDKSCREIYENDCTIDENNDNCQEIDVNSQNIDAKDTETLGSEIKTEDAINNDETELNIKDFSGNLSENNWKIVHLTEEEALKEFRAKAQDAKYLHAAFKCGDCFKGFSKRDTLERHVRSRHSEDLGPHECRVCRARFKWRCHLRKHVSQHYSKFECLRCNIVLHLDTSALLHEEYHSGTTKKCSHCNEEFRHMTTYYTHLRTHRSAHVCSACGASFVSRAGLRQHARRTHILQESSEEEDNLISDTFCNTCDIRFESRKAYEQHLFHSDMHAKDIKTEKDDDIAASKKILGKRLREQITKELRKGVCDVDILPMKSKRRKKTKKKQRIPTTCHQCGEEFSTQSACMKHHTARHPRTSFYAPAQRHICELCGASLAPGSVAVHKNMHSREKTYTCDNCGRQFHSTIGLKRHLLTHTGEKPYGCPLCEKKFTQSNSMKLHYRTFHLKQPYPKRNRKKKKEVNQEGKDDSYDSESLPEQEVTPEDGNALNIVHNIIEDDNMQYLALS